MAAGVTPYQIECPGSYFHKPHASFSARLEHAMIVRISKDGYLPQQVTLTNGPFEWVAVTGRHHGNYFLLKSAHFEMKLETISFGDGQASERVGNEGPMRPHAGDAIRSREQNNNSEGGSVAIASDPEGADIYIEGKFVGQTPSTIHPPAGSHHVEVRTQGRQSWERDLEVLKDSQLTLHAVLHD